MGVPEQMSRGHGAVQRALLEEIRRLSWTDLRVEVWRRGRRETWVTVRLLVERVFWLATESEYRSVLRAIRRLEDQGWLTTCYGSPNWPQPHAPGREKWVRARHDQGKGTVAFYF